MSIHRRRINKKVKRGGVALSIPPVATAEAHDSPFSTFESNLQQVENLLTVAKTGVSAPLASAMAGADSSDRDYLPSDDIFCDPSEEARCVKDDAMRNGAPPHEFTTSSLIRPTGDSAILNLIDARLQSLIENSAKLERERLEIQALRSQLQHAIDSAEMRMAQIDHTNSCVESPLDHGIIDTLRAENERLSSLLIHTRSEYQTLLDFIENEDIQELTTSVRNEHLERECELNREIDKLKEKINLLQDDLGSSIGTGTEAELKKQLTSVRNELMDARHEVVDLRLQCNELASRLAKFQDPCSINHDTISWEDRKQALLHMLEQQDQEELDSAEKILEMKQILEETSVQIQIREKEIADLRSLLEQQSIAANGLAVGAAAIANLVDADEIIAEERQRLKEMQAQWEQKQRQGEIEMSLERAKLARERLEIQEKLQQLEAERDSIQRAAEHSSQAAPAPHKGRWWNRLGLKDD